MSSPILIIGILFGAIILYLGTKALNLTNQYIVVNKHKNYSELFVYFLDTAYDSVYKDQIMPYTASGYRPSEEDLETIKRNFVKLTRGLMGKNVEKYLVNFFGSEQILTTNILMFLSARMDNDELMEYANNLNQRDEDA